MVEYMDRLGNFQIHIGITRKLMAIIMIIVHLYECVCVCMYIYIYIYFYIYLCIHL